MFYIWLFVLVASNGFQQAGHFQDSVGQRDAWNAGQGPSRQLFSNCGLKVCSHFVPQRGFVLPLFNSQFYSQFPQLFLGVMFAGDGVVSSVGSIPGRRRRVA